MSSPATAERKLKLQVVRVPGRAKHIFSELSGGLSIAQFQQLIATQFNVPVSKQALFVAGVPPRALDCSDESATLTFLGIRPGDSIELREDDGSGSSAAPQMKQGKAGSWDVISSISSASGSFLRKDMPRDNSCLFHSIAHLFAKQSSSSNAASAAAHAMRELAANLVAANPAKYNTSFLGSPNSLYQDHILNPNTWGGAIELSIFSAHFQCEILAFDLANLREDRFGSEEGYNKRVFVLYTGDHYDALAFGGSMGSSEQTIFNVKDETAWSRARDAVQSMHNELAAQGKCTRQTEWRHNKDLKRAHPASKAADIERDKRVQAEKAKISSSVVSSTGNGFNPTPLPPASAAASSSSSSSSMAAAAAAAAASPAFAATPLSPVSPIDPDGWVCGMCTCANNKNARRCDACDAPNPTPVAAMASATPPAPARAPVAAAAAAAAAAAPTIAAPSSAYVSPPGTFHCTTCTAFNERPSHRCSVCGSAQPGAAASSSSSSSSAAAAATSGSAAYPIDVDADADMEDSVRAPLPQRNYQLIGGDDDLDPAETVGVTPAQRAILAQQWTCPRCRSSHAHDAERDRQLFCAQCSLSARLFVCLFFFFVQAR